MTLEELEKRYPEWQPWLAQLGEALAGLADPAWDRAVRGAPFQGADRPWVVGAGIDPADAPMGLLHACRRHAAVPRDWSRGDCPVCGAWAAFAEVCGVERARFLRCVRCGSSWRAHALSCAFCGNGDHATLGLLVAEGAAPNWAIEVCHACKGYLKAFTVLRPCAPERTLFTDLGSVELDLAAHERGFRRPPTGAAGVTA